MVQNDIILVRFFVIKKPDASPAFVSLKWEMLNSTCSALEINLTIKNIKFKKYKI